MRNCTRRLPRSTPFFLKSSSLSSHLFLFLFPRTYSVCTPPLIPSRSTMRIRQRLQSRLPPPDSSFLPSPLLVGASATRKTLPERGERERAEEKLTVAEHVLERETGGSSAGFSRSNGDGLVPPPDFECISGERSDLCSHRPPADCEIDERDLPPHISQSSEVLDINPESLLKRSSAYSFFFIWLYLLPRADLHVPRSPWG